MRGGRYWGISNPHGQIQWLSERRTTWALFACADGSLPFKNSRSIRRRRIWPVCTKLTRMSIRNAFKTISSLVRNHLQDTLLFLIKDQISQWKNKWWQLQTDPKRLISAARNVTYDNDTGNFGLDAGNLLGHNNFNTISSLSTQDQNYSSGTCDGQTRKCPADGISVSWKQKLHQRAIQGFENILGLTVRSRMWPRRGAAIHLSALRSPNCNPLTDVSALSSRHHSI